MEPSQAEPPPDRIPDPAAIAQGHRLMRAAESFELPAWLCGALALLMFAFNSLWDGRCVGFVFGVALLCALVWLLWGGSSTLSTRARASVGRLPGEIRDLLALVDGLVDTLERGEDRLFGRDVVDLGVALDGLDSNARRYLDERGADWARLRHGVCCSEPQTEGDVWLSADRRRSLHQELLRFAAAAHGRACGDPYRSRTGERRTLVAVVRDAALARARWRHAGLLLLAALAWGLASQGVAATRGRIPRVCNPWGDNPNCEPPVAFVVDLLANVEAWAWELDLHAVIVAAVALVPMFLLGVAAASREAAWHCWAAALPGEDGWSSGRGGAAFRHSRGRERRSRRRWRALTWLACGVAGYAITMVDWYEWFRPNVGLAMMVELVTLALLVVPRLMARLERDYGDQMLECRVVRAPDSAVVLNELCARRRELEHAAPVRGELLEQLAEVLAAADVLGRLTANDRDRVVARLRAGALRGSAVDHAWRTELLLDVRGCEALIGDASK